MIAIALHRYHVIGSLQQTCRLDRSLVPLIITWVVSLIIGLPVLLVQSTEDIIDPECGILLHTICQETWPVSWGKPAFTALLFIINYVIPFIVISSLHYKILKFINLNRRYQRNPLLQKNESQCNRRTTTILCIVTGIFMLSWFPFHVFHILFDYTLVFNNNTELMYVLFAVVHLLAMSSTLWNALLYGFFNENLRHTIVASCWRQVSRMGLRPPTVDHLVLNSITIIRSTQQVGASTRQQSEKRGRLQFVTMVTTQTIYETNVPEETQL